MGVMEDIVPFGNSEELLTVRHQVAIGFTHFYKLV